jgi:hypothetical protein
MELNTVRAEWDGVEYSACGVICFGSSLVYTSFDFRVVNMKFLFSHWTQATFSFGDALDAFVEREEEVHRESMSPKSKTSDRGSTGAGAGAGAGGLGGGGRGHTTSPRSPSGGGSADGYILGS